jgi:cell fate (sporulation/competence/biofilm development) regulator YlbF (YheA/YmcA/DUF963 family)
MDFTSFLPIAIKIIEAAKLAIPAGHEAVSEFNTLEEKLRAFQQEGRDPTPEEFRALQAQTDQLTDRLEAANARLGGH